MVGTVEVVFEHVEAGTAGTHEDDVDSVCFCIIVGKLNRLFEGLSFSMLDSHLFCDGRKLWTGSSDEDSVAYFLLH